MKWFQDSKDLVGITIAALAVAVSFVTVLLQRRQQQRAAYREIYSTLMSEDLHRGRWLVNRIKEVKDVQEKPENRGQTWAWPQLWTLFEKAANYRSTLACCAQDGDGRDS